MFPADTLGGALAPSGGGRPLENDLFQKGEENMKKRILSFALSLTLCLGLTTPAFAVDTGTSFLESGSDSIDKLSKEEIVQLLEENPLTLPDNVFDQVPSCSAPYSTGKVKTSALQTATDRLNALRQIAGLPNVQLDLTLCEQAQYGAVIIAAQGALNHNPSKPSGMDNDFYERAYDATSSSNLYADQTLTTAVDGFMDDSDTSNIDRLGHRRWQLNPGLGKIGFGYAESDTRYRTYVTEKVFDKSGDCEDYKFISWPASGNFPSNLFDGDIAWSVSLNTSEYRTPRQSDLTVTLVRESDGKTWTFRGSGYGASDNGAYFHIDTANYGIPNCIIFRPEGITSYEGVYTVTIDGLKSANGNPVDFSYQVDFFNPDDIGVEPEKPQETTQPEEPDKPQRPGQEEWPIEGGDLTVVASGNSTVARDYVVLADGRLVNWKDGTLFDTGYQAVSFAENRYMGLKADGTLWVWGEWYSLSDNTLEEPVEVLSSVKQISGYLALKEDGSVWSPEPLKGMEQRQDGIFYQVIANGIAQISSYREDAGTAVAEDGTLYSWGSNWDDAYLGRETDSNTGNPPASILNQVSYVNGHFAIREDGSLWSWGSNTFGTVGNGSGSIAATPVKVMDRVVGAWADEDNLAAVRTADGTLWTWGVNNAGELGYADFDNRQTYGLGSVAGPGTPYQSTPKAVQMDNVIQVTAGGMDITLALKSDGTLWASGKGYGPAFIKVMDGVKTPGQEQQPTEQEKPQQPEKPNETTEAVFTDVPANHWAHDYVEKAAAEGWVNGVGNNRFAPDKEISYAEFSTMLIRAYYADELNTYTGSSDPWFMPYCTVAHNLSLYDGTNMGQSAFDAIAEISCNRYEMAQLLYNILNDQDAMPEYDAASVQAKIGDWSSITGKYKDAVTGVFAAGLIGGVDANGTFNGDGVMTRAQAATVMCRLAELIGD